MLRWGKKAEEKPEAVAPNTASSPAPPRTSGGFSPVEAPAASLPDLLLAEGRVTEEQLNRAMVKQAETGQFIGEILIEEGILNQDSLISFLAKHCKIPHLSLLDYLIDKDIVKLLPEAVCMKYRLLPIDKLGKNLTVAMVNPLDAEALETVRQLCPELRLKPILCASNHFEIATRRLFASAEPSEQHALSASSLGLKMPGKAKPAEAPVATTPPLTPAPELIAAPPAVEEEIALPPLEPLAQALPVVEAEELIPDAVEIVPVEPLPVEVPVSAPAATVLNSVFNEPAPAPGPPPSLEDSGLGEASSMLMKEMATVMMDSMRDTYAVLARRMDLFRGVPPEEVAKIFARGITHEFEAGDVIFEKGQSGTDMYVILGGEVIIRDGARELARLGRGGMFGEMALISAQPRSADAVAADTTSILALSNDTVRQGMPPHVSIQLLTNVITTLSARLRQANAR